METLPLFEPSCVSGVVRRISGNDRRFRLVLSPVEILHGGRQGSHVLRGAKGVLLRLRLRLLLDNHKDLFLFLQLDLLFHHRLKCQASCLKCPASCLALQVELPIDCLRLIGFASIPRKLVPEIEIRVNILHDGCDRPKDRRVIDTRCVDGTFELVQDVERLGCSSGPDRGQPYPQVRQGCFDVLDHVDHPVHFLSWTTDGAHHRQEGLEEGTEPGDRGAVAVAVARVAVARGRVAVARGRVAVARGRVAVARGRVAVARVAAP